MVQKETSRKSWRYLLVAMLAVMLGVAVSASAAFAGLPANSSAGPPIQNKGTSELTAREAARGKDVPKSQIAAAANPDIVLYDQYNNFGQDGIVSTSDPGNPPLSAETADDFVVPAGQSWVIQSVDFHGYPTIPLAGPVTVRFYTNAGTLPGTVIYTSAALTATGTDPNYSVTLNSPPTLPAGTYWVSVQATQTCCWYWGMRTQGTIFGNQAAFREGGGFGTGCTDWGNRDTCTGTILGDQMFRLNGVLGGPTPTGTLPTSTSTPLPTSTPCPVGNYSIVTGVATIVPGTTNTGSACDDCVTDVTIPFSFTLYDQTFTQVGLDSNGKAHFPSGASVFSNSCLPQAAVSYTIYPYWDDLLTTGTCTGGCGIFTSVSGTAPNRIFNIEWRTTYFSGGGNANFELRLYEAAPSRFEVIYGALSQGNTSATAGAQRNATTFVQDFCNGVGT